MTHPDDELRQKIKEIVPEIGYSGVGETPGLTDDDAIETLMQLFAAHHARQTIALLEGFPSVEVGVWNDKHQMFDRIQAVPLAVLDAEIAKYKKCQP